MVTHSASASESASTPRRSHSVARNDRSTALTHVAADTLDAPSLVCFFVTLGELYTFHKGEIFSQPARSLKTHTQRQRRDQRRRRGHVSSAKAVATTLEQSANCTRELGVIDTPARSPIGLIAHPADTVSTPPFKDARRLAIVTPATPIVWEKSRDVDSASSESYVGHTDIDPGYCCRAV